MKTITQQLSQYKSVHFNKKNIATHFVGIPLIIWSITLLLSLISFELVADNFTLNVSLAQLVVLLVILYYFKLHWRLAILMTVYFGANFALIALVSDVEHPAQLAVGVFIVGWIFQFIGHYYEKAKPAFVDDLNQLFIGPLFLMAELCFICGCFKTMEKEITEMATTKRRALEQKKKANL